MSADFHTLIAQLSARSEFREMNRNMAIQVLHELHGVPIKNIALYYHISPQRVYQLLNQTPGQPTGRPPRLDDEAMAAVTQLMKQHGRGITAHAATEAVDDITTL